MTIRSLGWLSLVLVACGGATAENAAPRAPTKTASAGASAPTTSVQTADMQTDRSEADKAIDGGRKPGDLLRLFDLKPGMVVAELGAGGGYTSELLARAVGPNGRVFGQNSRNLLDKFAEKPWSERLKKPVMANVTRLDREFDDPFPAGTPPLDLVVINLFYHDTVWLKVDRDRMNKSVLSALKKGGRFVVIDHSARKGTGVSEAQTTHRIEESVVMSELTAAGFKFNQSADFLRNPSDTRDWSASPSAAGEKRGQSDRFVLVFEKP